MNEQAKAANEKLPKHIVDLLFAPGKKAYFPSKGIMMQSKEAKQCNINASIGVALDEEGQPLVLAAFQQAMQSLDNRAFLYSHSFGNQQLREAWQKHILATNPGLQKIT